MRYQSSKRTIVSSSTGSTVDTYYNIKPIFTNVIFQNYKNFRNRLSKESKLQKTDQITLLTPTMVPKLIVSIKGMENKFNYTTHVTCTF